MTDAEKALEALNCIELSSCDVWDQTVDIYDLVDKNVIETIRKQLQRAAECENTVNRDTGRIRAYAQAEISLLASVQDLQHQVNKLTDERFQLYQDLDEVRERDKAATSNYNLMLEHLTEEKRIQDAINQAWATDARKEYKTLKDRAQGLLKALSWYSNQDSITSQQQFVADEAIAAFKANEIQGGK